MSTKLDVESFRPKLGEWMDKFLPFFETGEMDKIFSFLKSRRPLGYKIIPSSEDTFKAFSSISPGDVKAIIYLQTPYPWVLPNKEGRKIVLANGIPLDCSNTEKCQPSLLNFYGGIAGDIYGKTVPLYEESPSVQYLIDQGIMLINSDLTTELNIKNGHEGLWREFMKFFLEEIINIDYVHLPIILAGSKSQVLAKFIDPLRHRIMYCEHPAAGSYSGGGWNTIDTLAKKNKESPIGVIKKTDYYLKDGGVNIEWLKLQNPPF